MGCHCSVWYSQSEHAQKVEVNVQVIVGWKEWCRCEERGNGLAGDWSDVRRNGDCCRWSCEGTATGSDEGGKSEGGRGGLGEWWSREM